MTDQLKETGMTNTETRCRDCDGYNCDNGCAYPPRDTDMQIPDDVMEAAVECAVNCYDPKVETFFDLRDVIARATFAERERAAKVCGKFLMINSNLGVVKIVECEESIINPIDK